MALRHYSWDVGTCSVDDLPSLTSAVVLVPVKSFHLAKQRLAGALSPAQRVSLARSMAERVLAAASPLPVAVVCDDPEVAGWAKEHGASVIWTPGMGLNMAVQTGVSRLALAGATEALVVHGDLPMASGIADLGGFAGITIVPDRHQRGTNVLGVPARSGFRFSYGQDSCSRHLAEASRLGLATRVLRPPQLSWDVDTPEDLSAGMPGTHEVVPGPATIR